MQVIARCRGELHSPLLGSGAYAMRPYRTYDARLSRGSDGIAMTGNAAAGGQVRKPDLQCFVAVLIAVCFCVKLLFVKKTSEKHEWQTEKRS